MIRTPLLLTLVAAAALAGCDNGGQTIVVGPEGGEEEASTTAERDLTNVQLPPSIVASDSYRCRDGSVVQIDWLSDNKTANFRGTDGVLVHLTAPEPGQPMTAEGFSLTGTPDASSITLERPDKGSQACKR
ncbi:MAG: hypothetical protein ACR2JJ_06050 [Sphingomicrobium sp.]